MAFFNKTQDGKPFRAGAKLVWLAWEDATFETARRENKPIFLMIGFSACRWCRLQWEEIQKSEPVRRLLQEHFLCAWVDRDERPDLDAAYLAARQEGEGTPGWPLLAFLTPERLAFYLSGFLPGEALLETLRTASQEWEQNREKLEALARENVEKARARFKSIPQPIALTGELFSLAVRRFRERFDVRWGGFGTPPKFPMPLSVRFLLRQGRLGEDEEALSMGLTTLRRVSEGEIFDHVGGGILRYARSESWREPEGEKMLSDNALFADACLEAWGITKEPVFLIAAERTLGWMLREMRTQSGAFCAAQSEEPGESVFLLARGDMMRLLGENDGTAFCTYYGIETAARPSRQGHDGIETPRMSALCERVWRWRQEKTPLFRDEKILTAPNALAIQTLCRAYEATGRELYREAAEKAAQFLFERMQLAQGIMAGCFGQGELRPGTLEDTAQTAVAALALYSATLHGGWLDHAVALARSLLRTFGRKEGGFYMTPSGAEKLFVRPVDTHDGATASGNAAALDMLVWLDQLDIGTGWREAAQRQASFLSGFLYEDGVQHAAALLAVMPLIYPTRLLDSRATAAENKRLLAALHGSYQPLLYKKTTQPSAWGSRFILTTGVGAPMPMRAMEEALSRLGGETRADAAVPRFEGDA